MGKAEQVLNVHLKSLLLSRYHVTDAFIDHQFLVKLEIFTVFWNQLYQIDHIWCLIRLILLGEHVLCQF